MRSGLLRIATFGIVAILVGTMLGPVPIGPSPAFASTIVVNTLEDSFVANGNCSLREAISSANLNLAFDTCAAGSPGADTIQISIPGTITLAIPGKNEDNNATGDLDVFQDLTIVGQGAVVGSSP